MVWMKNNMRDQRLLPEFQDYLLSRGLVPEKNIRFMLCGQADFCPLGTIMSKIGDKQNRGQIYLLID